MDCLNCGKKNIIGSRNRKISYCSRSCVTKKIWQNHRVKMMKSLTIANQNIFKRQKSSDRMTKNNPMRCLKSRVKMRKTLKLIGHRPLIRGGNGREMPLPQRLLLIGLGNGWFGEHIVPTKKKRNSGYPSCYKIDIGNPKLKLGIEVDGLSHGALSRQKQDKKKIKFLENLGWEIYQYKNKYVMENLEKIIKIHK